MNNSKYSILLFGNSEPLVISYLKAEKRNEVYNELKSSVVNGMIQHSNKSYHIMQKANILETFFAQKENN